LIRKAVWKFEKLNRHAARTSLIPSGILRRAASSGTSRSQPMSCFSMHSLTAYVFLAECGHSRAPFMREFPS
jgi:hypothetical protein